MRKGWDVPALLRYDLAVAEFAYLASISVTVHSAVFGWRANKRYMRKVISL